MADSNYDKNIVDNKKIKLFKSEIENKVTTTSIQALNNDCLSEIFSYFSFTELINLDMVCTRWSSLCQHVWENVFGLSTATSAWFFRDFHDRLHREIICEKTLEFMLKRCGKFVNYMNIQWFDAAVCMDQLSMILPLCPNLRCLIINAVPSAIAMRSLRDSCVNLTSFSIEGIGHECEEDLSITLSRNPEILHFSIRSSVNNTTGEFLKNLPHSIDEIIIGTNFIFLPENFTLALKKFKRLRSLSLEPSNRFETSIMEAMSEATSISKLSLRHNYLSNVSPDAYSHLSNLINLVELDLWFARDISEEAFMNIVNNCTKLVSLSIGFCLSITNDAMRNIARLTKLKTLRMEHLCKVTDEPIGDLPETLEILVCSHNNRVKDDGVIRLMEKAPRLTDLALDRCAITKNIVLAAINIIKRRTNGVILRLNIRGNGFISYETRGMPPLLRIIAPTIYDWEPDSSDG